MKVLAIIPARGGSKEIPRKNLKKLNGKPLIQYTIESALNANCLTDVVVSTEDPEIAKISSDLNVLVPGKRPSELAGDHSPTIDTVIYTVNLMKQGNHHYDVICLLQPTSPFRKRGLIDQAILKLKQLKADSLISVISVPHQYNPHWVFEPSNNGFLQLATGDNKIIPRRQELPPAYFRDGAIYLTETKVLLELKSFFGHRLTFIENQANDYVNLDTMEDWRRAEELIKNKFTAR